MNSEALRTKCLPVALELAQQASQIILQLGKEPVGHERKADRSMVTEADLRSDELIRRGLEKKFPDHAILTEEFGLMGHHASDLVWMVDPLDGTKAFARNLPGFCVMIGLLQEGRPVLGVVADPLEGRVYEALRGGGTFHRFQGRRERVEVSRRENFPEMPLIISTGFPEKKLRKALERLGSPLVPPINSVGIKVGLLVRQVGDIYLNHHSVHYWDTCAPQIILEEAGGVFTKLNGDPLSYSIEGSLNHGGPTLASNGTRHPALVDLLEEVGLLEGS